MYVSTRTPMCVQKSPNTIAALPLRGRDLSNTIALYCDHAVQKLKNRHITESPENVHAVITKLCENQRNMN